MPSKPPSNVHATVDATAIVLKWDHPPYDSRNGYIKEYEIGYKSMIEQRRRRNIQRYTTRTGTPSSFGCSQEQATCVVRFSGLNPYQKFAFRVAAKTVAGVGRYSDVRTFRTAQAGNFISFSFYFTFLSSTALRQMFIFKGSYIYNTTQYTNSFRIA